MPNFGVKKNNNPEINDTSEGDRKDKISNTKIRDLVPCKRNKEKDESGQYGGARTHTERKTLDCIVSLEENGNIERKQVRERQDMRWRDGTLFQPKGAALNRDARERFMAIRN